MNITNSITPEEYMGLRKIVGWNEFPLEEAEAGLKNSIIWCIRDDDDRAIGLARLGVAVVIIVRAVMTGFGDLWEEKILDFIHEQLKPGYRFMVSLCSAKGKDSFYEKFGFVARPNDDVGPGMHQWFYNEANEE